MHEEKDHTCISGFCPYCIRYNRICDGSIFRNVYAAEEVHTERLADFADLLDDGQEEELEAKLDQVSEDYGCDVVVVTEETLDGAFRRFMQMISLIIMTMAWERTRVVYCF